VVSGDRKCEELSIIISLLQFCVSLDPLDNCAVLILLHTVSCVVSLWNFMYMCNVCNLCNMRCTFVFLSPLCKHCD
jgi:hypothetical protein